MPKLNSDVSVAFLLINKQRATLDVFYRYYNGSHALNYASEKYLNKFLARIADLNVNLCKRVVNAPVSRLEVLGFAAEDAEIVKKAWAIWKASKMPLLSKKVHREAYRTGSAFVLVWVDPETKKARIYPQEAKNCRVWRDGETGKITKAAKMWREDKQWFLTLYYPDRIEKYATGAYFTSATGAPTSAEIFKPRTIQGEPFPLPNPFGVVPLFEFQPLEGESILSDVIPINKSLNKTVADIQVGGEYNTLRQRWTTGTMFEQDPETGKKIIPFRHDDQYASADEADARIGEFSDVDLEKMLKVEAQTKQRVAQVTGIPAHFFNLGTGDYPSGEALETAEAPFVSIVEDAQLSFGETWSEVMAFSLFIDSALKENVALEVQWTDAGRPGLTKKLTQATIKKSLGVSTKQVLSELGYSEKQIEEFAASASIEAAEKAKAASQFFNGGGLDLEQ